MRGHFLYWLLVGSVMVALSLFGLTCPAAADGIGVQILGLRQIDLNGDSQPDMTVIDCSFATPQDRVYVYDGGGDMRVGNNWEEMTDFINDTWVFDVAADGNAQLILHFALEEGHSVAYFYDDLDGDGRVAYQISGQEVRITESARWALKVESESYWFLPDGSPNLNLRFLTNGKTDRWTEVVDKNHDGIPEYQVSGLFTTLFRGDISNSSGVWVNAGGSKPAFPDGYIFWPFLGGAEWYQKRYKFDSVPFVGIDWAKARLTGWGVSGYPIEAGYGINSFHYWQKGQINYANFENPRAYYDLAEDQDGQPELHVRLEYFGPLDSYLDIGKVPVPINDIRYSWNQRNSQGLSWDYKVALAGTNLVTSSVWLGDFGVQMVPYEELPTWVSDSIWAWGTLVANEGIIYVSSEGIYEWTALDMIETDVSDPTGRIVGSQQDLRNYLAGRTDLSPDRFYKNIRPGLRGEFGYLQDHPYLYFSPIDAKLHLRKAIQGVWNIGNNAEIRYANRDGDGYLDEWLYSEEERINRRLIATQNYLLYSGEGSVILKQAMVPPSLFETLPPRNHAEWLALGRLLETHQRDFAPGDFKAMMDQFDGPTMEISGAMLRDFRPTPNGFRFVLELQPGFRQSGEDWLGLTGKEPGAYVVSYAGTFHIQPLTPPSLRLAPADDPFAVELPTAYIPTETRFHLSNTGLEDASSVAVTATFTSPSGAMEQVVTQTVSVLAGETVPLRFVWTPTSAGHWRIQVVAQTAEEEACPSCLATTDWKVKVTPPEEERIWDMVSAWGLVPPWAVLLLLGATATTGGLAGIVILHLLESEAQQHRESEQV